MIIKRDLIEKITPFLKREEFISIIGPRQSGKTTLFGIIQDYLSKELNVKKELIKILSFEDRKLILEFEKDPLLFIRSYMPEVIKDKFYFMIDEFQYVEEGGQKLKLIYDTIKDVKIFITGSSSLDIKAHVGKFMVGRVLNFCLYPFNFGEYLRARDKRLEKIYSQHNQKVLDWLFEGKDIKIKGGEDAFSGEFNAEFEKFCIWGGYPAMVLAKTSIERKKLLTDIYNNYILKDIKMLLELTTERNLFLLSQYLATQIGSIVVYEKLGNTAGLDYRKLKNHLNILYETFICKEVRPFFKNRQKELSKNPKVYFMDLGFRNNLMDNMNGLEKRSDAGAIIENASFIRLNELCEGINKINFWRTKAGAEVDFIIHIGNRIVPIEIKYTNFSTERISKSLMSFIDSFEPDHAAVLTRNYWGAIKRGKTKVIFIPVYYL